MNLIRKIYEDFLKGSMIDNYHYIIKYARDKGYLFHTVLSFENIKNSINNNSRIIILRRNVDTADFNILKDFLKIENLYGAKCSYYFRLLTINSDFMKIVEESGGEASYHYEELSQFAYLNKLKTNQIYNHLPEIRAEFAYNYNRLKNLTNLPMRTVASHGDFINIKIGIKNTIILNDKELRSKLGIIREAYDDEHMSKLSVRIADQTIRPLSLFTKQIIDAINKEKPVIEILTHPRQWNSNIPINLKANINRLIKGFNYARK